MVTVVVSTRVPSDFRLIVNVEAVAYVCSVGRVTDSYPAPSPQSRVATPEVVPARLTVVCDTITAVMDPEGPPAPEGRSAISHETFGEALTELLVIVKLPVAPVATCTFSAAYMIARSRISVNPDGGVRFTAESPQSWPRATSIALAVAVVSPVNV